MFGTSFILRHVLNIDTAYHFEFWSPTTDSMITSASVGNENQTPLATLMIIYNSKVTLRSITVTFGPLKCTEDNTSLINYEMDVLVPNTSAALTSSLNISDTAKSVELLSTATSFDIYSQDAWNTDEIADFAITLNTDSAKPGHYEANVTCTFAAR